jgi:hypothetical protein
MRVFAKLVLKTVSVCLCLGAANAFAQTGRLTSLLDWDETNVPKRLITQNPATNFWGFKPENGYRERVFPGGGEQNFFIANEAWIVKNPGQPKEMKVSLQGVAGETILQLSGVSNLTEPSTATFDLVVQDVAGQAIEYSYSVELWYTAQDGTSQVIASNTSVIRDNSDNVIHSLVGTIPGSGFIRGILKLNTDGQIALRSAKLFTPSCFQESGTEGFTPICN